MVIILRFRAVNPDGRVVSGEVDGGIIRISRQLHPEDISETIECKDESGIEAYGIEIALQKWWVEGWEVTVEDI